MNKLKNFYIGSNKLVQDANVSDSAVRIYDFIRSKENQKGWEFSTRGIASCLNKSHNTVAKALKELERLGYIIREQQTRKNNGVFGKCNYCTYLEPCNNNCDTKKGTPCNNNRVPNDRVPISRVPNSGTPLIDHNYNNNNYNNNNYNKDNTKTTSTTTEADVVDNLFSWWKTQDFNIAGCTKSGIKQVLDMVNADEFKSISVDASNHGANSFAYIVKVAKMNIEIKQAESVDAKIENEQAQPVDTKREVLSKEEIEANNDKYSELLHFIYDDFDPVAEYYNSGDRNHCDLDFMLQHFDFGELTKDMLDYFREDFKDFLEKYDEKTDGSFWEFIEIKAQKYLEEVKCISWIEAYEPCGFGDELE